MPAELPQSPRWISFVEAAEIAGCSPSLIAAAARRGEIVQRHLDRGHPSLDRASATAWAHARRVRLDRQAANREDCERGRELGGRPDAEHMWLHQGQAAALLGVSKTWVRRLADQDRLPFTVVDGRRWFRQDHLQLVVAARAARR